MTEHTGPDRAERPPGPNVGRRPAGARWSATSRSRTCGCTAAYGDGDRRRGRANDGARYSSYIPHGFVADWTRDGTPAARTAPSSPRRAGAPDAAAPDGAAGRRPAAFPAAAPGPGGVPRAALRRPYDRCRRWSRQALAPGSRPAPRRRTWERPSRTRRGPARLRDPPGPVRRPAVRRGRARRRLRGAAPGRLPGAAPDPAPGPVRRTGPPLRALRTPRGGLPARSGPVTSATPPICARPPRAGAGLARVPRQAMAAGLFAAEYTFRRVYRMGGFDL